MITYSNMRHVSHHTVFLQKTCQHYLTPSQHDLSLVNSYQVINCIVKRLNAYNVNSHSI